MPRPSRKNLRVLIVDDEPLARQRLVDLLGGVSRPMEVAEAGNGQDAVDLIERGPFDVVFLDVQMPGLTGFDVVRAVGPDQMPLTVFVTAYDTHAVAAFDANALDYLLKPFSEERFLAALAKVETRLEGSGRTTFGRQLAHLAFDPEVPDLWDRLVIRTENTTRLVPVVEIDLIESAGVYVTLHVAGKEILYRAPLHVLAAKLDPKRFIRVHRSAIVNIESVLQLDHLSHGEFEVILKHGARTKVSRSYRSQLEARLGQSL